MCKPPVVAPVITKKCGERNCPRIRDQLQNPLTETKTVHGFAISVDGFGHGRVGFGHGRAGFGHAVDTGHGCTLLKAGIRVPLVHRGGPC